MRLIRFLPLLFTRFRKEAIMFWHVMRHPQTPVKAKFAALLAVLYVISPIDLIPDVIPVLGWMDDAGMLVLLLSIAYKLLPRQLYESLRAKVHGNRPAGTRGASSTPGQPRKREPKTIDAVAER
jgi:uncharacterized membrane protein YkvA (DUF1232 family)